MGTATPARLIRRAAFAVVNHLEPRHDTRRTRRRARHDPLLTSALTDHLLAALDAPPCGVVNLLVFACCCHGRSSTRRGCSPAVVGGRLALRGSAGKPRKPCSGSMYSGVVCSMRCRDDLSLGFWGSGETRQGRQRADRDCSSTRVDRGDRKALPQIPVPLRPPHEDDSHIAQRSELRQEHCHVVPQTAVLERR